MARERPKGESEISRAAAGSLRARSAAVRGAGPGPRGKRVRKRRPDTLLAGVRGHRIREVGPRSALLHVVSFLAIFFAAKSKVRALALETWPRVREGSLLA